MAAHKIMIVGSGGREHAIAWRCHEEGQEILAAPGSDAIGGLGTNLSVAVDDLDGLVGAAREHRPDVVIIGPEAPLVAGLGDRLRAEGIPTVGPSGAAAELEGSKAAAKAFMDAFSIPTARHVTVTSMAEAERALADFDTPPVVKADGLAAGKGVTVPETEEEARAALRACLEGGAFGAAGATVVLEERLLGQEASVFVLTDGTNGVTFLPAQDHKRLQDDDRGPNTGGMGAYVPAPVVTDAVMAHVERDIIEPTLGGLREQGRPFVGVLFFGLMIDPAGSARVIEYNVRFGDPEAQPLLFGLTDELTPRLLAAAHGELRAGRLAGQPAASVVIASRGYPASSSKGDPITGIELADAMDGVQVFHAGTRRDGDGWVTNGGRVLGVCARHESLSGAIARAYAAADAIDIPGGQMRRDIGARALEGA